jgi:hypothetical protein
MPKQPPPKQRRRHQKRNQPRKLLVLPENSRRALVIGRLEVEAVKARDAEDWRALPLKEGLGVGLVLLACVYVERRSRARATVMEVTNSMPSALHFSLSPSCSEDLELSSSGSIDLKNVECHSGYFEKSSSCIR